MSTVPITSQLWYIVLPLVIIAIIVRTLTPPRTRCDIREFPNPTLPLKRQGFSPKILGFFHIVIYTCAVNGTYRHIMATKHNWLNDISRDLNEQIRQQRRSEPSMATRAKWHQEWLISGAQYRQTFLDYCAGKTKQWHQKRDLDNWTFGTGKYRGTKISSVFKNDLNYIILILERQPNGKTAKQIINYVERNPQALDSIKKIRTP